MSHTETQSHSAAGSRGRERGGRASYRNRARGRNQGRDPQGISHISTSDSQLASVEPYRSSSQSNEQPQTPKGEASRGGRNQRRHRYNRPATARAGRIVGDHAAAVDPAQRTERSWGAQLTRRGDTTNRTDEFAANAIERSAHAGADVDLRADAPEFVPGQLAESVPKSEARGKRKAPHPPRRIAPSKTTTKSIAPDIKTRTHEDIANGLYECPICTNELSGKSRIWSCRLCWTVFHLSCIKKWSKNNGSLFQDQQQNQDGNNDRAARQWRCPGCNLPQDTLPASYSCWCEKEIDPRPLPGIPPHSCGQTCSRPRGGCPHPCDLTCHAGPCPPCTAMGPTQYCFCGSESLMKRCVDTDYDGGRSCGRICGDQLPCGKHTCARPCHEGLCGACEAKVDARCYCGRMETRLLCHATEEEIPCQRASTGPSAEAKTDTWTGSFHCQEVCNRPFDCGVHFCQKSCHAQDVESTHCPRSPDVVLQCPCGKTPLSTVKGFSGRTSCEDPIPNCSERCGETLPCGHLCPMVCHTGPCRPCLMTVQIKCRCGRSSFNTVCHQGNEQSPQCFRTCKATMNCGRHTCAERCCPGERKAIERQATKRKLRSLNVPVSRSSDDDVEPEHICTRVCGRMLKCGRHTCPELCHKGPCSTCREAIFDEISCHCGRSVLYPPLPCGTEPPPCRYDCERPKACGHPQTPHNCHTDDESCPKCPFLTEKPCLCGKRLLKNQPCWLADARCGLVCGELLKCGSHSCQKQCHRPSDCEDSVLPCKQPCGKIKKLCGHPCSAPCHAPYPCLENEPCSTMALISCGCGRLRKEKRCNAARAVAVKGSSQQQQDVLPSLSPLKCDEECARLERNRSLATALKIDIDDSTNAVQRGSLHNMGINNLPYSAETLDLYVQLSRSSTLSTLQDYESALHGLATSETQRSVRFQPAKSTCRAFVHSLAADWGFASESFDPEPHRHVFVLKPTQWNSPGFGPASTIGIGGMTVGECVRFRERELSKARETQRTPGAIGFSIDSKTSSTSPQGNDGWAQVASRRKNKMDTGGSEFLAFATTRMSLLAPPSIGGKTMYAALSQDSLTHQNAKKKDGLLVLRSANSTSKKTSPADTDNVVNSWEEEVEREEQEAEQFRVSEVETAD
jgi:transcriptional repressor NF-X1